MVTSTNPTTLDIPALLNRASLSLSRSRKLVESWLPLSDAERAQQEAKTSGAAAGAAITNGAADGNEEARREREELGGLVGRPERAGLGAVISSDGDGGFVVGGKGGSGNSELEKLRKQFLGKKAIAKRPGNVAAGAPGAAGSRGSLPTGKIQGRGGNDWTGVSDRKRAAEKVLGKGEDDDDEEEGRTGAVKARGGSRAERRVKKRRLSGSVGGGIEAVVGSDDGYGKEAVETVVGVMNMDPVRAARMGLAVEDQGIKSEALGVNAEDVLVDERVKEDDVYEAKDDEKDMQVDTAKSKAHGHARKSYLDEILAERAQKKKKKKRKNKNKGNGETIAGTG